MCKTIGITTVQRGDVCVCVCVCGGGGGGGGLEGGYDEIVDVSGFITNPDYFLVVISIHLNGFFLRSMYKIGIFFGG